MLSAHLTGQCLPPPSAASPPGNSSSPLRRASPLLLLSSIATLHRCTMSKQSDSQVELKGEGLARRGRGVMRRVCTGTPEQYEQTVRLSDHMHE